MDDIFHICQDHPDLTMVRDPHYLGEYWASPFPQAEQELYIIQDYIGSHEPRKREILSRELSGLPGLGTMDQRQIYLMLMMFTLHKKLVEGNKGILLYEGSQAEENEREAKENQVYLEERLKSVHYTVVATYLRHLLSQADHNTLPLCMVKREPK